MKPAYKDSLGTPRDNRKDKSTCIVCGSRDFYVDVTDTIEVILDANGEIEEYGKRYDDDLFNLNCARCGHPVWEWRLKRPFGWQG